VHSNAAILAIDGMKDSEFSVMEIVGRIVMEMSSSKKKRKREISLVSTTIESFFEL